MAGFDDLIEELERSYREAQERLSDPAVYNDHREAEEVGRRLKKLEGPYRLAQPWNQAKADLDAARNDPSSPRWLPSTRAMSRGSRRS